MKTCIRCGEEKPLTEYWAKRSDCKPCARKRNTVLARSRREAAKKDITLHQYGQQDGVPENWDLFKNTQHLDKNGNVIQQWVRAKDRGGGPSMAEMIETLQGVFSGNHKLARVKKPKERRLEHLMGVAPVGDGHIGLLTWKGEVGEDYDLQKAAGLYAHALRKTIDASAEVGAERFLLATLGDWVHVDGPKNSTTKGTPQSVAARWPQILELSIKLLVDAAVYALETHKQVDVSVVAGNHDEDTTCAIVIALKLFFSNNPRITVNASHSRFHYYKHGLCLIGTTHGDMAKPDTLPGVMACDRPHDWGDTKFRHWYSGHIHHSKVLTGKMSPIMADHTGASVETMRVLVPTCKWAHSMGFRSARDIRLDMWDARYGRVQQNTFGILMLEDEIDE